MKKIISIMFSVLLALSVSITAFASTEDEASLGIETQIKQAYFEKFYESRYPDMPLDDIHICIYCTSSDGGIYFSEWADGLGSMAVYVEKTIGDYYYCYNAGDQVYLYKDDMIIELKEAYDNDIINDNTLNEINPMINALFPKIGESGLDSKIEWDLKYSLYNIYFGTESTISQEKIESIQIHYYGTTSDGNMYVSYTVPEIEVSDEMLNYTMGDYVYNVTADKQVYFYHDEKYRADTFCTIQEAYDNGLIDNAMLSEVSALNFGLVNINDVTASTETTTPDTTSSTEAPEAESTTATNGTKPASTSDTATANNSNNAVQTGQSSFAILSTLLVIALSGAVVVFTKHGYNK